MEFLIYIVVVVLVVWVVIDVRRLLPSYYHKFDKQPGKSTEVEYHRLVSISMQIAHDKQQLLTEQAKWRQLIDKNQQVLQNNQIILNHHQHGRVLILEQMIDQHMLFIDLCNQVIDLLQDDEDTLIEPLLLKQLNSIKVTCKKESDRLESMYFETQGKHYRYENKYLTIANPNQFSPN